MLLHKPLIQKESRYPIVQYVLRSHVAGYWNRLFFVFKSIAEFDLIGSIIYAGAIAVPCLIITDKSLTHVEKQRVWVILYFCFFVIFFWSAFEQAGASTFFLLLTNKQIEICLVGKCLQAFSIFNAIFIVIFATNFFGYGAIRQWEKNPVHH